MTSPRRWVLHPSPGPLESLSSYLTRLAACYDIRVADLLAHNLGLVGVNIPADLDYAPPSQMLAALADRTGVELGQLSAMTLAGWELWLFDVLAAPIDAAQAMFDAYVRDNSVLLAPGEAGSNKILSRQRRWPGFWIPQWPLLRACPVCATDPTRGTALVWRLALMTGCVEHGCRLDDVVQIAVANSGAGDPLTPVPLEEPAATVDGYTHQALTTGRVDLPGRSVHAGVWFRLLRSLLDELTLSPSAVSEAGRRTLRRVWDEAGIDERAGLKVWKPYETMDVETQDTLRHAASTALHLASQGTVRARGRLASAIQPPPVFRIYDGDRPAPRVSAWDEAMEEVEAVLALARTDRDTARQLLAMLTFGSRTLQQYEQERAVLFGAGIPAAFLPSAHEMSRFDLA